MSIAIGKREKIGTAQRLAHAPAIELKKAEVGVHGFRPLPSSASIERLRRVPTLAVIEETAAQHNENSFL